MTKLMRTSETIRKAQQVLQGQSIDAGSVRQLVKELKYEGAFGHARRILALVRSERSLKRDKWARQQHALCTYKDADLPVDARLDNALSILEDGEDLQTTKDQETLGIAGAVFKRRWEWDGQKANLERSLSYYLRGYAVGPGTDRGYTGINAAFLLDRLASLEEREARDGGLPDVSSKRAKARDIRLDLINTLRRLLDEEGQEFLAREYWFLATIGEAFFGVGDAEQASSWLQRAAQLPKVPDWEREATARQLAWLLDHSPSEQATGLHSVLSAFLAAFPDLDARGATTASKSLTMGKVGLALSGGGFRASFFHIGVLARLAELDLLRHVEVLSCVSGGSIVGAYYYLEVRRLLEGKSDGNITRTDYIDLLKRIEIKFLKGVQRNIRMRIGTNLVANFKMLFVREYSRTHRLGELYEKELYARIEDNQGGQERWLDGLFIKPVEEKADFEPKRHNWRRQAKVPMLGFLNALQLSTRGHSWQFTASFFGEPPGSINSEVDGNERLRRLYYRDAPKGFPRVRLGHAVAASSCVPGLFGPFALNGLYEERTIRLVDGGVYDNQGVAGLLEQDCAVMLVSDASGQMGSKSSSERWSMYGANDTRTASSCSGCGGRNIGNSLSAAGHRCCEAFCLCI